MTSQSKKSILCPNCRRLIGADQPRCPYCGLASPGAKWKNHPWIHQWLGSDQLLHLVIYVNVGMFIISLLLHPAGLGLSMNPLTVFSPSDQSLFLLGATGAIPIDRYHRWWTLVAANYLHGGILHIFFNMMALKQIGPVVIQEYGPSRMLVLYALTGMIGFWVSYLVGIPLTLGASASVCGLIGAMLYYGRSRGGVYGRMLFKQIGGWVIGLFCFGLIVPGINNWGHGGGLVAGVVLGFLLGYQEKKRERQGHKLLAAGCALLTAGVLIWAVFSSISYLVARAYVLG